MIDFRSDTITRPTPEMRAAIAAADVGDDVFGEDPTVRRLEERIAAMLGKPAAAFVPSGTMGNQLGVRVHCQPGDEFLCEANCHIYNYEQAAYAQLFGIAARPISTEVGVLTLDDVKDRIQPDNVHRPRTRLLCLENTHNRAAGHVLPYEGVKELGAWAAENGLACHLDGARLFNAAVASGISADKWGTCFDTISVCFSKGLGAPVGSALVGPEDKITLAKRVRKALGGGWRQAGLLAAACLYALDHNIERLAEDHANCRLLVDAAESCELLALDPPYGDTNIVIFRVDERLGTAADMCARLKERGVLMMPFTKQQVRAVTHLDVTRADCAAAAEALVSAATP